MNVDPVFDRAIAIVLAHEGGLVDDPADPGGLTNFGFAENENRDLTPSAIRSMTRDQAVIRYRDRFWAPYRWRDLPDPIAIKTFDISIDQGAAPAIKNLQRAVRSADGVVLEEDGVLGDRTVEAVIGCAAPVLLAALKSEMAAHYRLIAAARAGDAKFLNGWLARAYF